MHRLNRVHLVVCAVIVVLLFESLSYFRSGEPTKAHGTKDASVSYQYQSEESIVQGTNSSRAWWQSTSETGHNASAGLTNSAELDANFATISQLIVDANNTFTDLLAKQTMTLEDAAEAYRLRRATWRGTATGGRHNALNWPNFHRHRFVALTNGTKYSLADETSNRIFTRLQQQSALSPLRIDLQKNLGSWITNHNDVAFTDLFCDIPTENSQCWYLSDEYEVGGTMSLADQYASKFLPDIDGNSFSGRYRSFLLSKSVPIKATLYREWHDSRLVAWKHFVPMNNRFTDYYAVLSYFVGCGEDICGSKGMFEGHDAEAEEIARAGSEWAGKVLRKVDMQIYVARLLLEYGRLTNDNRDFLGWVDDLKSFEPPISDSSDP
ncbi:hypothetical protein LTR40_001576 [Exophiala xenobiotica]|nr:hypothetical protein LTR40_001576 [Exophiala xenobiotica]